MKTGGGADFSGLGVGDNMDVMVEATLEALFSGPHLWAAHTLHCVESITLEVHSLPHSHMISDRHFNLWTSEIQAQFRSKEWEINQYYHWNCHRTNISLCSEYWPSVSFHLLHSGIKRKINTKLSINIGCELTLEVPILRFNPNS